MPDVNIEYNPKDWGGYLKEYTTETEYNNAIKPLPHAARITGTQEVKFAGGYEPINSAKWITIGDEALSFHGSDDYSDFDVWLYNENGMYKRWPKYYLCGKIDRNSTKYYLWKWDGNYATINMNRQDYSDREHDIWVLTDTDDIDDLSPIIDTDSEYIRCYLVHDILNEDMTRTYHGRDCWPKGMNTVEGSDDLRGMMVYAAGEDQ